MPALFLACEKDTFISPKHSQMLHDKVSGLPNETTAHGPRPPTVCVCHCVRIGSARFTTIERRNHRAVLSLSLALLPTVCSTTDDCKVRADVAHQEWVPSHNNRKKEPPCSLSRSPLLRSAPRCSALLPAAPLRSPRVCEYAGDKFLLFINEGDHNTQRPASAHVFARSFLQQYLQLEG